MKILKTLIISDIHLEHREVIDKSYQTIKNLIIREKFDRIIINGDFFDFSYISRWTEDSPGLTEGKRLKSDFDMLENELRWMKKYCKDITYLEGNHEERVQVLINKNPVLEGIISINQICSKLNVEYVETIQQPYKIYDDLFIVHGLALTKYASASNVEKSGVNIVTGHAHRTQLYTTSQMSGKPMTGYSIGCISSICPNYVKGKRITGWSQSFAILNGDEDIWDIQIYMLKQSRCIVNGKVYSPVM